MSTPRSMQRVANRWRKSWWVMRVAPVSLQARSMLTRTEGLPQRPWYRHFLYAPGFYTGYGVKTLPGVREAIEQRDWAEAKEQIEVAGQTLNRLAQEVNRAKSALSNPTER